MPASMTKGGRRCDRRGWVVAQLGPIAGRVLSAGLLVLVGLPLGGLLVTSSPGELLSGLKNPLVGPAVRLSLVTTAASVAFVVASGTPLAWAIARGRGRGWRLVETVLAMPVVLPPAVAGVALLVAFGRTGVVGAALESAGIGLPFTRVAVVAAQSFVAGPLYLQAAVAAFRRIDPDILVVARTLGASPSRLLLTVAIPVSWAGLAAGAALCWARALGEFGATLMFAGNMPGRTQTLPVAIYAALEADLQVAQSLSVALIAVAFALLTAVRAGARA